MGQLQIVKFQAIDRPLSEKQLEFMSRQSSRAEYTRWAFEVEYHYSSFRGDIDGMLRNGYDIFLMYSSYGMREVRMRLPNLPVPQQFWAQYGSADGLSWTADETGNSGILSLTPCQEELYEPAWEFNGHMDAIAKLRARLIAGDLRALYAIWLCCASASWEQDTDEMEPQYPMD